MATLSLYRRYRPRRFGEIRGQDHVVRALRNAVLNEREGQGYLFSGPRGTGKTTSARVLAKVLNCTNAVGGEPCCVCDSCVAVETGTSFDVHELDAASNNGVDAMRDLIEKASLGTPGRHKVYILDEVHMLSKGAEAALLKTLEEPPPHVVFVLATTDPQKVSATIRSRVQHLEFHLLPLDELEAHIRWVAADAGLVISDDAFQAVLAQGGGSARDTLSALELVAASGGEAPDTTSYDEFIEAFINTDAGQALAALAHAVQQGRDPRSIAQDIIRRLRDCFLSLMAPELVQLPDAQAAHVGAQAQRLGAAAVVRAMERLGTMLVEMRHAPDPRLLLDIALVQLTNETSGNDLTAILARLDRVEKSVAAGAAAATTSTPNPPVDPTTGRATIGGRLRRDQPAEPVRLSAAVDAALTMPADPDPAAPAPSSPAGRAASVDPALSESALTEPALSEPALSEPAPSRPAPSRPAPAAPALSEPAPSEPAPADAVSNPALSREPIPAPNHAPNLAPNHAPNLVPRSAVAPAATPPSVEQAPVAAPSTTDLSTRVADAWQAEILPTMKPMARALFSAGHFLGERDGALTFGLPNEVHRARSDQYRADVQAAIATFLRCAVTVALVVETVPSIHDDHLAPVVPLGASASGGQRSNATSAPPGNGRDDEDRDIDLDDLVDVPPGSVKTAADRLNDAFPGSVYVEERT
ncbi:MAG: DNA polymerase III subunit gamma/tau [Ilumatobacteraceae bacterium]